jgi:hypothetical protein
MMIRAKNGPTRPVKAGNWIASSLRSGKPSSYAFEGFNTTNGRPARKILEDLRLKEVADVMQSKGKLG